MDVCMCVCVWARTTHNGLFRSGKGERTHDTAVSRLVLFELLVFRRGRGWTSASQDNHTYSFAFLNWTCDSTISLNRTRPNQAWTTLAFRMTGIPARHHEPVTERERFETIPTDKDTWFARSYQIYHSLWKFIYYTISPATSSASLRLSSPGARKENTDRSGN